MNTETIKGITCNVFYNESVRGCALGGPSVYCENVTLVGTNPLTGEEIAPLFEPDEFAPAVVLRIRSVRGMDEPYLYAIPKELEDEPGIPSMMGGSFIHTSDSRFPGRYPIPLHDRVEHKSTRERTCWRFGRHIDESVICMSCSRFSECADAYKLYVDKLCGQGEAAAEEKAEVGLARHLGEE